MLKGFHTPEVDNRIRPNRLINSGPVLEDSTANDFSGGLDLVSQDLTINSRFAKKLDNLVQERNGGLAVRGGTTLFADAASLGCTEFIEGIYFGTHLVYADKTGMIVSVDGTGETRLMWSSAIAASLAAVPWSSDLLFASFTQMKSQLVICNGVDKPLVVAPSLSTNYLVDLGTLLNTNVPIAKYCHTHNQYLILAGNPSKPSRLYIGSKGTVGTFFGDPPPNDGVNIDLDAYIDGDATIVGLGSYREFLVVFFPKNILIGQLGTYDSLGNHVPSFSDPIPLIGTISHRTIQTLGDDLFFCDVSGAQSLRRAIVTGKIEPLRISQLVDSDLQTDLNRLPLFADDKTTPFAIFDKRNYQYMLFIPNASQEDEVSETIAYAYTFIPELKISAWNKVRRWNWRTAVRSLGDTIFFSSAAKVYIYGTDVSGGKALYDFIGEQEAFSDGTLFTDYQGWTPGTVGIPIPFVWELPWSALKRRMRIKTSRVLKIDTTGSGEFLAEMFVDEVYLDDTDPGEPFIDDTLFTDGLGFARLNPLLAPALSATFVGADTGGYGIAPYGSAPFGGGRNTKDERMMDWAAAFTLMKFRLSGISNSSLTFNGLSLAYQMGTIGR